MNRGSIIGFLTIVSLLALLMSSSLFASEKSVFSERSVANTIVSVAKKKNIRPEILYTIASIESDFEPLAIAVETSPKSAKILSTLRSTDIRVIYGDKKTYHSKIAVISLYPKNLNTAKFIIKVLEQYHFCFDVGIMQINTYNFTQKEVEAMFYPKNNIRKAAVVYNDCKSLFKTLRHRVECYNRGGKNLLRDIRRKKHYYPYWERFKKHYSHYFKEKIW